LLHVTAHPNNIIFEECWSSRSFLQTSYLSCCPMKALKGKIPGKYKETQTLIPGGGGGDDGRGPLAS